MELALPTSTVVLVLLRSLGMGAVAIVPLRGHWQRRRSMVGAGAGAWFVSVALKVAWALPMNSVVRNALLSHLPASCAEHVFAGYVGMLTGVFEVVLVFGLASLVRRFRAASVDDALAFGLGFGGVEALGLGVGGLAGLAHPEAFVSSSVLVGPLERGSATMVHVVCCLLVMSPVFRKDAGGFVLAFGFKSLVDAVAVFAILDPSSASSRRLVVFEVALAVMAIAALHLVRRATIPEARAT